MKTIVLISGVTGGIGSSLANEALKKGYTVIGLYKDDSKYINLIKTIDSDYRDSIIGVKYCYGDTDRIIDIFSALDKMVYDALCFVNTVYDIRPMKHFGDFSNEEIKKNINTNVFGTTVFINSLIRYNKNLKRKLKIINIDSGAGYRPIESWGLYCCGKAYINMMLKMIREENESIEVIQYDPGVVDTKMQTYIRTLPHDVFSGVDEFIEYKNNGDLVTPKAVAIEIMERFIL